MHVIVRFAVVAASLVVASVLRRHVLSRLIRGNVMFRTWPRLDWFLCKYLTYGRWIHRHGRIEPWTAAEVMCVLLYAASVVGVAVVDQVRPGDGSVDRYLGSFLAINMVPLYFGPTHDLPAWLMGLSLRLYRRLHRVVAWGCVVLTVAHSCLAWRKVDASRLAEGGWTWILLVSSRSPFDRPAILTS